MGVMKMNKEQGWGEGYSGDVEWADCVCYDCGKKHKELLPVEYIQDVSNWRINGDIALNCNDCYLKNKAKAEQE